VVGLGENPFFARWATRQQMPPAWRAAYASCAPSQSSGPALAQALCRSRERGLAFGTLQSGLGRAPCVTGPTTRATRRAAPRTGRDRAGGCLQSRRSMSPYWQGFIVGQPVPVGASPQHTETHAVPVEVFAVAVTTTVAVVVSTVLASLSVPGAASPSF
jgi:hypothetical protein